MALSILQVINSAGEAGEDLAVRLRLQRAGHSVTQVAQTAAVPDLAGYDLVVITNAAGMDDRYKAVTKPVLCCFGSVLDTELDLCASQTQDATLVSVTMVTTGHPMAGGLNGTVAVYRSASNGTYMAAANLGPDVTIIARRGADEATIVAYEAGGVMAASTVAPARRASFPYQANKFTSYGWRLFERAVNWCAGVNVSRVATVGG